jgi:hypothetical protein
MSRHAQHPEGSTRAEAEARIQRALDHIEQAQRLMDRACQEISSIEGMCPDWQRLGKIHQRIEAEWHRLNHRRKTARYDLDGSAAEQFIAANPGAVASSATTRRAAAAVERMSSAKRSRLRAVQARAALDEITTAAEEGREPDERRVPPVPPDGALPGQRPLFEGEETDDA